MRAVLSFGQSDPLHMTLQTLDVLAFARARTDDCKVAYECTVIIGQEYQGNPALVMSHAETHAALIAPDDIWPILKDHDVLFCGTGATMLQGLALGMDVRVVSGLDPIAFRRAFTVSRHYDHAGKPMHWKTDLLAMCREIHERKGNGVY